MLAGGGAVVASAVGARFPSAALALDPEPRTGGWAFDRTLVTRGEYGCNEVLWTTLMRVDDKLPGLPSPTWYLWQSTHADCAKLRLYTASSPQGPFVKKGDYPLPAGPSYTITQPAPWPAYTFTPRYAHLQAPDVVWDPVTRYFYATPHSARTDYYPAVGVVNRLGRHSDQFSLLMRSADGLKWEYVDTGFSTPWGDRWPGVLAYPGYPSYGFEKKDLDKPGHLGYGRFLRDYGGNLQRADGTVIWYYRGSQLHAPYYTRPGVLVSSDFVTWVKVGDPQAGLFNPADASGDATFSLGSGLLVNGQAYLVLAVGTPPQKPTPMYLKQSGDPLSWTDGPGSLIYQNPKAINDGGSYVVDADGAHYMTYTAHIGVPKTSTGRYLIDLARALPLG